MHVEDAGAAGLLLRVERGRFETHLLRVEEVPVLVHIVVVRVEALLAQVAEVVLGDVTLGAVVEDEVLLHTALPAGCLTYIVSMRKVNTGWRGRGNWIHKGRINVTRRSVAQQCVDNLACDGKDARRSVF